MHKPFINGTFQRCYSWLRCGLTEWGWALLLGNLWKESLMREKKLVLIEFGRESWGHCHVTGKPATQELPASQDPDPGGGKPSSLWNSLILVKANHCGICFRNQETKTHTYTHTHTHTYLSFLPFYAWYLICTYYKINILYINGTPC